MRIPTSEVNSVLREAVAAHPPPSPGRRHMRIKFGTQASVRPPTFVFFANDASLIHFSYRRYLENALRKRFGFEGTCDQAEFPEQRVIRWRRLTLVVVASYLIGCDPDGLPGRANAGEESIFATTAAVASVPPTSCALWVAGRSSSVMVADALKGYIPTLATWYIFQGEGTQTAHALQVAAGIAAVIGHDFPVYIGFRGGSGVATSFGVYAAMAMPLAVGLVAVGLFIVLALRYMSVMSMITVPLGALRFADPGACSWRRCLHVDEGDIRNLRDRPRLR